MDNRWAMKANKMYYKLLFAILTSTILLVSCDQNYLKTPSKPIITSSNIFLTTQPTMTKSSSTTTPEPVLQLTFVYGGNYVYGIDVGCLDQGEPCFGERVEIFHSGERGEVAFNEINSMSWSPDGQKLAVSAVVEDPIGENHLPWTLNVFVGSPRRGDWINLSNEEEKDIYPQWSSDGLSLFFLTILRNNLQNENYLINSVDIVSWKRSGLLEKLPEHGFSSVDGFSISPDGKKIAFIINYGTPQIYISTLDGSGIKLLNELNFELTNLNFSPNGSWIIAESYKHLTDVDGYGQIREDLYLIDSTSGVIKKLTFAGIEEITSYAWSPVGNWLAIVGRETGKKARHIFLIHPNGTDRIRVPDTFYNENLLTWRSYYPQDGTP
jgi:Tol biopolymer transport system component